MIVEVRGWRARPEAVEAETQALDHGQPLPAEGRARLDRDAQDRFGLRARQHRLAPGFVLRLEPAPIGQAYDPRRDPLGLQPLGDLERQFDLGAGTDEDHAGVGRIAQHITAATRQILGHLLEPHRLQILARQAQHRGAVLLERLGPAFGGLDRVGRAPDLQIGDHPQRLDMLDRLVRRAILAEPDRIMRHDIDDARILQRRQADRRAAIIGEDQEGPAIGDDPAVQRHAVHRRGHAELADAVIDVAPGIILGRQRPGRLGLGIVGAGEVGRAADGRRDCGGDHFQRHFRRLARGERRRAVDQGVEIGRQPALVGLAGHPLHELSLDVRRRFVEALFPLDPLDRSALPDLAPGGQDVVGDGEFVRRQAELLARRRHLVLAERRAVGGRSALFIGRAIADHRLAADQARPHVGDGLFERLADLARIEPVAFDRVPARRGMARHHVLGARQVGRAVDGDLVVVPQHDQPPELEMPGQAHRLVVDALHQAAVAGDDIGAVIDQIVAVDGVEVPLGDRHADCGCKPLAERTGGRLDAVELEILGVTGAGGTELPEAADVIHRRPGITGQVKQRVDQHRAVARRQDEAVAVGPFRVGWIVLQGPREQGRGRVGHAHRHAGMARICGLHRVHGQRPDGIGKTALGGLHRGSENEGRPLMD